MPTYDNNTMNHYSDRDAMRKYPHTMLGSDGVAGAEQAFLEIVTNSRDEWKNGFGDSIEVTVYKDGSVKVADHGRGIPMAYNEKAKQWNWYLSYCSLFSGGKHDHKAYSSSAGIHGVGAAACQLTSAWFKATSVRDGYMYHMEFKEGEPVGELSKTKSDAATGTTQMWLPDPEVFTDTNIPLDYYRDILNRLAIANDGLRFILDIEETGEHEEYYYEHGIRDYADSTNAAAGRITESYEITGSAFGCEKPEVAVFDASKYPEDQDDDQKNYRMAARIVFAFNNQHPLTEFYHESLFLPNGGAPDKAIRSAFVSAFDAEIKQEGKYKAKEKKVTYDDIADCLICITSTECGYTSWADQDKKSIDNKALQSFMTDLIKSYLKVWFIEHKDDGQKAIDQVLVNKRSRESAENTRITVKKELSKKIGLTSKVKNLMECRSKDPKQRELFICEGQSALGSIKMGRNAEYQAVICVRGKVLNLEKASIQQIFKSDIIMDLMRAIGCGIEVKAKGIPKDIPEFDMGRLNYDKIIIMTDADVDGNHISALLITMIYKLCPALLEGGHIYIAKTPLFEIKSKKSKKDDDAFYAFDDSEKDKFFRNRNETDYIIQRSKGLGENSVAVMARFMDPATRHLVQIKANDAMDMQKTFQLFMGSDVGPRKDYIEAYGDNYVDLSDLQ